jgi:hypothetical protein
LQNGFQQGNALVTAGVALLVSNAVPITAGIALFHERLSHGRLLDLQLLAYALIVLSAALLVGPPLDTSEFPYTGDVTVRSNRCDLSRRTRRAGLRSPG